MAPPNRTGRRRRYRRLALVCILVSVAIGGPIGAVAVDAATTASPAGGPVSAGVVETAAASASGPSTAGHIVAVYPNTLREGDEGEYVVLSLPAVGEWTLSDGETTVSVGSASGIAVLTPDPDVLRRYRGGHGSSDGGGSSIGHGALIPRNATVIRASLGLANGGERLTLRMGEAVVHRIEYGDAAEGERYRPATDAWRPIGFSPRAPASTGPANATAFVLPDAPDLPVATLESAEDRVLLAGYTFSSPRVADALVAAARRNVTLRVLVEAAPVGGVSRRQARLLDRLVAAGVDVRVIGEAPARYAFHHPKYAVVDDRALVLTENWKPAGTGGRSSRGWGVRVDDVDVAVELAAVFGHDARGPDVRAWSDYRRGRRFEAIPAANGTYPTTVQPAPIRVRNVTVLTAPGNAESAIVSRIDAAETRVDVVQPTLGSRENALLRATLRAARRGVQVRILLSGAWYVAEENAELVRWLDDWADRNDAPLDVRLAEPGGRYEKIHAKGVLIDDEVAVVGSLNWNRNSARENREVALSLRGPAAVSYYREVFEADWNGEQERNLPVFAAGAVAAVVVAGLVARRTVSFAPGENR